LIRSRIHNTLNDHSTACNCRCTHGQHSHTRNRASNQQNVIILFATACKPNNRRCAFPALGCALWRPPKRRRSSGAASPGIPREDRRSPKLDISLLSFAESPRTSRWAARKVTETQERGELTIVVSAQHELEPLQRTASVPRSPYSSRYRYATWAMWSRAEDNAVVLHTPRDGVATSSPARTPLPILERYPYR